MAENEYEVGYKKPPTKTRFKKGKSGNPRGRPRGSKNQKEFAPGYKTIHEFQKLFVDVGYEDIQVIKEGQPISMSKIEAMLSQLYNKAIGGHLGAVKILLTYTQSSMKNLEKACQTVGRATMKMRETERKEIFTPPPKKGTYGEFLMNKHEIISGKFMLRELYGRESTPVTFDDEPIHEFEWVDYNRKMREKYHACGDRPIEAKYQLEVPSIFRI